eukprot:GILK01007200.1.p1 GENE.GILK01007200.1~~GILK01007200.1.p1  ORF type:complete len:347 (+),score=37.98 GILK01007200.1:132-1172(+)
MAEMFANSYFDLPKGTGTVGRLAYVLLNFGFAAVVAWASGGLLLHSELFQRLSMSCVGTAFLDYLQHVSTMYEAVMVSLDAKWLELIDGIPDQVLWIIGSNILFSIVFWGYNLLLFIPDLTGYPQWLQKYKVQPLVQPVKEDKQKFWSGMRRVLFNQLVVTPMYSCFVFWTVAQYVGVQTRAPLPRFWRLVYDGICFFVCEELLFYYSHRLLHHPRIYKYIHKIHHEWQAPIGITAIYAHPLEHVVSNMLPLTTGVLLTGGHIAAYWIWQTVAIFTTVTVHSGYHLPFLPSPQAHDFHHLKFNYNFGVSGVLDYVHGTDSKFREFIQKNDPNPFRPLCGGTSLYSD